MLNLQTLCGKIRELSDVRLSLSDFEDWFRDESRNVHLWGDEPVKYFVWEVEDVFSQYHFEFLPDGQARALLEKIALRAATPVRHETPTT